MSGSVQPQQQSSGKRKANLLDYFTPNTIRPAHKSQRTSIKNRSCTTEATKSNNASQIPGLQILLEFVTEAEEHDLITFLDNQQWRTDLARRVIHYGGTYCLMAPRNASPEEKKQIESKIYTALPIPSTLDFVIDRMIQFDLYSSTSAERRQQRQRPEYCIVNSYTSAQGISAHVENFRFASPVTGLTLLNGDWMRFHELTFPDDGSVRSGKAALAQRTGRKVDVWLPRRSLLVMSGEARDKWQHEIVRSRKDRFGPAWRRVSLTFRTLKNSK